MQKTAAISGKSPPPRRILVLAFPQAKLLDVTGPCEVFADANRVLGRAGYEVDLVAAEPGPFETSSGVHLVAHHGYATAPEPVDTLLVSGGPGVDQAAADPALLRWIERAPGHVRRVGSVCTGAFLLAAAGVLDARRATTHWAYCDRLAREYPRVAAMLRGEEAAKAIQLDIQYAPEPPFDCGLPERAPPELVERLTAVSAELTARRLATAKRVAARLNVDVGVPAAGSPTAGKSGQQTGGFPTSHPTR